MIDWAALLGTFRSVFDGTWTISRLRHILCVSAVGRFAPGGVIELLRDDTLHPLTGPKVAGSGISATPSAPP